MMQAGARTAIWTGLLALAFCVAAAAQPFATVEDARGVVLVRTAGQALWVEAGTGQALQPGDALRTGAESSASLSLPGGSTTVLLPMTRVALQSVTAPDGLQSVVLDVQQGRIMARMNFDNDPDRQFVLRANQAVMRGRSAGIFLQADGNSAGCFDVFSGAVTAAALSAPDDTVKIEANHRAIVQGDSPFLDTFVVSELPAESSLGAHQCMAVPEKAETPPAADASSHGGAAELAAETTTSEPSETSSSAENPESLSPDAEEEQYVTVSVSSSSSVKFGSNSAAAESTAAGTESAGTESAQAAESSTESDDSSWAEEFDPNAACKLLPTISGVTANGKDANAGMTVTLEYSQCGDMEMTIEGTASSECGSIREVTVLVDDKKRVVEGKKNWKAVLVFEEEDYHSVSVPMPTSPLT